MHRSVSPFQISGRDAKIGIALAGASVIVLLLYFSQDFILRKAPSWLKPFAQEEEPYYKRPRRWSFWTFSLMAICLLGFATSMATTLVPLCFDRQLTPETVVSALEICPWMVVVSITVFDRPIKTPKLLLLQYLFMLFATLTTYSAHFLDKTDIPDSMRLLPGTLSFLAILTIGNMPLRDPSWGTDDIGAVNAHPSHIFRTPEDNLTLFQFWTMTWVYPLANVAKKRELFVEDVWQLPVEFQHTRLYVAFRELKGKLLPCLIEANGLDLCISTILAIVEKVSEVSNIRLTSKLYRALDSNNPSDAAFWCTVMLSLDCVRQVSKTSCGWYSRKAYERSRGETFIALFGKLLTRAVPGSEATEKAPENRRGSKKIAKDQSLPESASNAKVVNLVRGDTYEISQRFWEFHRVVAQPIKVAFTVYYLVDIMGWTSCIGFGLMFLFLACNSLLVRQLIKLERERAGHSDRRAQAVAHFVEASRPLKLNGWTSSWSDRIMKFRDLEMEKRFQISSINSGIATVNVTGGVTYPLASICLYTLVLGDGLPNDVIWPSLQLFGHLEASVKEAFDLISAFWKATIPVERVNKYMAEPDRIRSSSRGMMTSWNISFSTASFSWPSTGKTVLRDINLSFDPGLTIVRGKVGSGKSSLLLAALNELELVSGRLNRPNEPVAYSQQLPWLQSLSIRDNILFHRPLDRSRYREVLEACALVPDLTILPDGDQTRLEEGGIGLSGGQKARVALARALYSQARILLLDDPLAALDHDTASTIVERFLGGPLSKGRTIVMVTHRDDLVLEHADKIIDMRGGLANVMLPAQLKEQRRRQYHASLAGNAPEESETETETETKTDNEDEEEAGKLVIKAKDRPEKITETGGVPFSIYTKYMKAGGWYLWICLAFCYSMSRYCDIARARLLEAWGQESAAISRHGGYWGLPDPELHPKPWLGVLAGLSAIQVLSYLAAQILLTNISINAAQELFKIAVQRVSKATFRYYDTTPTGQLKNRLISDMGMVDGGILSPLESFVYNLIALTLSLTAIMSQQPSLLIILLGVSLLFVYFFQLYVPISRSLRRMEMQYLTPIIANIGVMQDGLVTIRALRVEKHFQDKHLSAVDDFQKQDHFFWSMAFWLDCRLGMSSACMRVALILATIWYGTPASAVGFVLTQTTVAMGAVQQLCEKFAALQLDAVSLERVDALNRIPEEPSGGRVPPEDWPRPCDSIKFESMSFKYDSGLPSVLENVSFEIPGGTTCAVLGRTGSGKSTIANALLATQTPFCGKIKIGSVDLAEVDRTILRNRITFIQQDPTLFPGTLRDNIDPEGKFSNQECENAIHRVLGDNWSLNFQIDAGGKNLSQGQRQLVGIGRAVLRRSGLVILDEATASIDCGTAARVQRILREELARSTVITIAHRLEAVEDANWCLRLDHGKVVECGPANIEIRPRPGRSDKNRFGSS